MIRLGPLTIFARDCGMWGAWELRCFGGWLVVFPPVKAFKVRRKLRAYWSPNATPWHHGLRPFIRAKKSLDCSCGARDCPCPREVAECIEAINRGSAP